MRSIKFIFVLVVILLSCSTFPERREFSSHKPVGDNWEQIFDHPMEVEVTIWNTGEINTPIGGLINLKHNNAPEFSQKKYFVDVPVYLIQRKNEKPFLIDAGLDDSFKEDRFEHFQGVVSYMVIPEARQQPGQSIGERLKENNITLSAIFFTHMHFDHTAGLVDIEIDFPLVGDKREQPIDVPLLFHGKHFDHAPEFYDLDFTRGKGIYPFDKVLDLFGDASVFAIQTNGHTSGHISYLINSTKGPILIGGDQINIRENISSKVGPGTFSKDVKGAQIFFDQLMEFVKMYPQTKILMGHEIE